MPSTSTVIKPKAKRFETPNYSTRYIVSYTNYLIMKAQLAGNLILDGHKPSAEEKSITLKLRELSGIINRKLLLCGDAEIADLLECYELTYRMGFQHIPDMGRVNQYKHRLVRAWKSNNRHMRESSVCGMISGDVQHRSGSVDSEL